MKEDFARSLARSGDLISFHINDAQIFRLHETFTDLRRGAHDSIFVDAVTNITVVRGGKAPIVKSATNIADLVFNLMQIEHALFLCYNHSSTNARFIAAHSFHTNYLLL